MKRTIGIVCLLITYTLILVSFTPNKYAGELPAGMKEGFIATYQNIDLKDKIGYNFPDLVDKVIKVEAYSNYNYGTYYVVKGTKNDKRQLFVLKTTKEEIENQVYTYIDFASLDEKYNISEIEISYCYNSGSNCLEINSSLYPICGVRIKNMCMNY